MKDKIFIDSNILIYAYSLNDIEKYEKSKFVIFKDKKKNPKIISTQSINEFTATLTKAKIDTETIKSYFYEIVKSFHVVNVDLKMIEFSYYIIDKYCLSWWDALLISTALYNDCDMFYSEDLQHNQIIENKIMIFNPLI